ESIRLEAEGILTLAKSVLRYRNAASQLQGNHPDGAHYRRVPRDAAEFAHAAARRAQSIAARMRGKVSTSGERPIDTAFPDDAADPGPLSVVASGTTAAATPIAGGTPRATSMPDESLNADDFKLLQKLEGPPPRRLKLVELETGGFGTRKTLAPRVARLEKAGYVHRPDGERGGITILPKGVDALALNRDR
ncbi:MAG: hypothetical protein ACKVU4_06975, partial [Phycisphaerales bacterium]